MRFMTSCSKFNRPSEYALPLLPQENRLGFARLRNGRGGSGQGLIMITLMLSSLLLTMCVGGQLTAAAHTCQDQALNCGGWGLAGGRPPAGTPPGATVSTQTTYATDTAQTILRLRTFRRILRGDGWSGTVCVDPGSDNTDPW